MTVDDVGERHPAEVGVERFLHLRSSSSFQDSCVALRDPGHPRVVESVPGGSHASGAQDRSEVADCGGVAATDGGHGVTRRPGAASVTDRHGAGAVSYTHLRAHETPEHLVCRLLLEKKKK